MKSKNSVVDIGDRGRQQQPSSNIDIEGLTSLGGMGSTGIIGEHMKAMWAGQSNVLVAVRVRPIMKHDVIKKNIIRVMDSKVVIIMDPAAGDKADILRANRSREKQYAFDHVFDPSSTQENCYLHTTKFLIHGVLDGFNATVFAYGQTGSGKTHTMIGNLQDPGIMVRVMDDLFIHSSSQGKKMGIQFKCTVSFLEVYNENIRDLLSDTEEYLDLREDPIKGPVVAGITEFEAKSASEIMQLLHQGNNKRSQAATAANDVSSRSHAVLQVIVESRDKAPGVVANIKVGKLSLVDLAGSERAANTKNVGARLVEGANINRSLLALGNCINALGEKGNKGNFVPYRDSKLTRLLKDSLGGNCRTVMIANISSAESAFEETLNTLKYANRAKNIKTQVTRNVLNVNYHISEYVQLINNLRGEIKALKGQIGVGGPSGIGPTPGSPLHINIGIASPMHAGLKHPSTPLHILRESMKSAASMTGANQEGRELVNNMRQRIVENFQERMQLRRSLIELEDQNVQNSIEVHKRELKVFQLSDVNGQAMGKGNRPLSRLDISANLIANGPPEIKEAWLECEQLKKAVLKNNGMKKNIAKRLRHNEREAEKFREELSTKITGEDRRELMELQYQVGRLELENMELEQHRIVHESILKGKDLVIQKLTLQLAVRDKLIQRQQYVLKEHEIDDKVGYTQLALMEQALVGGGGREEEQIVPSSPLRKISEMMPKSLSLIPSVDMDGESGNVWNDDDDEVDIRELSLTSLDKNSIEAGDWSEIQSEVSDASFRSPNESRHNGYKYKHKEDKNNINQGYALGTVLEGSGEQQSLNISNGSPTNIVKGGIRAPRVGRKYRSSFENPHDAENGGQQPLRPPNKKNQGQNDGNDDGSNHHQRLNSADRLEPINRSGSANIDDFNDDSHQELYVGNRPIANNSHASIYPTDSNADEKPNRMDNRNDSKNDLYQRPTDRFKGDKDQQSNHGSNSIRTGGNSILNNGGINEKVDENLAIRGINNNNNRKTNGKQWVSATESEGKDESQRSNDKRSNHQNHQQDDNKQEEIQPFEYKQQPQPSRNYQQQQQQQLIDRQQNGGIVIVSEQSRNRQSNLSNPYQQQKRNGRQNEELVEDIGDNSIDNVYSEDEYSEGGRGKINFRLQQGNHQGQGQGQQRIYPQGDNSIDNDDNNGKKKVLGKLKNRLSNASGANIPPPGNGPAINLAVNFGVGNNNTNIERPQKAVHQPVVNQNSNQNNGGFGGPGQILAPVLAPGAAGIEKGIGGVGLSLISKKTNQKNDETKKKKIINSDKNSTSNSDGGINHNVVVTNNSSGNNEKYVKDIIKVGDNNPIVPSIGGRNRSLPNLPKNGGGPNSARSQPGSFR